MHPDHHLCEPILALTPLHPGREFTLEVDGTRQLRHRQLRMGDSYTVGDPTGRYYRARVVAFSIGRSDSVSLCLDPLPNPPEAAVSVSLLCAVRPPERMTDIIQAATEMGATAIQPVFTERSVGPKIWPAEKTQGWPAMVLRMSKQCRRSSVPELWPLLPLADALRGSIWREPDLRMFVDDEGDEIGLRPLEIGSAALVVGPDAGWTNAERDLLWKSGGLPLVLGGRTVRPDTALVAGLALLQTRARSGRPMGRAMPADRPSLAPGERPPPRRRP